MRFLLPQPGMLLVLPPAPAAPPCSPYSSSFSYTLMPSRRALQWTSSPLFLLIRSSSSYFTPLLASLPRRPSEHVVVVDDFDDYDDADVVEDDEDVDEGGLSGRRPRGFGEGKKYDTTIEDQVLQEMEIEMEAQAVQTRKKSIRKDGDKAPKSPQVGSYQVRLSNLPKKKNIHRDLQLAFKGFPGLVDIVPVVSGNKKTRDPVCRGFAFLQMESRHSATRFVELYSKKSLSFGKVEKQISCCVVDEQSSFELSNQVYDTEKCRQLQTNLHNGAAAKPNFGNGAEASSEICFRRSVDLSLGEEEAIVISGGGSFPELQFDSAAVKQINALSSDDVDHEGKTKVSKLDPKDQMLMFQEETKQVISKKKRPKAKSAKSSKLNLPGSASRLKFKERTILTGVLSKYSGEAEATLQNEG